MQILLTNDDGIDSPLLAVLSKAAAHRGHEVIVSAPHTEQSSKSHSFSGLKPLAVHRRQVPGATAAWSVEGTPVDCSRLGFLVFCSRTPDLVLSGINRGYNTGLSTYMSGTVGAAREAAFQRIPAIAASMHPDAPAESAVLFADYVIRCGEKLIHYAAPSQSVCNLNLPPVLPEQLRQAVMCGLSTVPYRDAYEPCTDADGRLFYDLKPLPVTGKPAEHTDQYLLEHGRITCSFLTPQGCNPDTFRDFPPEF